MTKAHEQVTTKTADDIEQKASEWVVKLDRDGSPETSRALAAWLGASYRHRAAFLRISQAWRRAEALRRLRDPAEEPDPDLLAPERPPIAESITEPSRANPGAVKVARSRARSRSTLRLAMAAGLGALVIGAWAWLHVAAGITYSTAIGEFRRVALPDGTAIALNTDSEVRIVYSGSQRRVELLRGEAQFDVVHDTARPFVVAAGGTEVRDVGTVFDVRMRDTNNVDVLVSEGIVAINPPVPATVTAGQMALVRNGKVTTFPVNDMTRRMAWLDGKLIFDGQTLAEAVAEFNRYNHRQLVISDAAIAGKRIGGAFRPTSPDHFGGALKPLGIEARIHEGMFGTEIRLYRGAW